MTALAPSRGRILLVDDEPADLHSYARRLGDAGFEVIAAPGGAEALQLLAGGSFDLVLSDISMPAMNGLALLRRMRDQDFDVPLILMVDKRTTRMAAQAVQQGAFQCLVKPVDSAALNRTADRAVRLHRRTRRSFLISRVPNALAAFRNRRGEQVEIPWFTATDAKNEFGRVLETAIQKGVVTITRHDAPKAVLLSLDEFNALVGAGSSKLDTLSGEFDALLARMQGPKAREGMKAAFDASPAQLGKAAVAAARKRG